MAQVLVLMHWTNLCQQLCSVESLVSELIQREAFVVSFQFGSASCYFCSPFHSLFSILFLGRGDSFLPPLLLLGPHFFPDSVLLIKTRFILCLLVAFSILWRQERQDRVERHEEGRKCMHMQRWFAKHKLLHVLTNERKVARIRSLVIGPMPTLTRSPPFPLSLAFAFVARPHFRNPNSKKHTSRSA